MVKTRRSVNGEVDDRKYIKRSLSKDEDEQDVVPVDRWSPRELRSHYRVTRKRQHWTSKFSGRLKTIKMPRIIYPESEDTEPEKFPRRRRPMRVFFEDGQRLRRKVGRPNRSAVVDRQLRPLQPNNYMEDSDKPETGYRKQDATTIEETEKHVRRSGRQRKLLHHTFNESWITNELKVKGYPRLFGHIGRMSSSSATSSEDERLQPKRQMKKEINGQVGFNEEYIGTNARIGRKLLNQPTKPIAKIESKTNEEIVCENGDDDMDTEKSNDQKLCSLKKIDSVENVNDDKLQSDENNETEILAQTSTNRSLRLRRGRSGDVGIGEDNNTSHRRRITKKEDVGTNSHSQRESGSDTENSSDSESEIVVRRQLRRSNRTRKPRNTYIESQTCEGKQYTLRKQPYTRKTYSLRERKQPKIIVRSQSPASSSSTSSDTEEDLNVSVKNKSKSRQKSKTLGEHGDRALREIQPIELDGSVRFSSVGGLEGHIRCLREMVLFPLMYPQLFEKFGTQPPRGVLFHGPPGTGKTLLARALASECSLQGGQKVSFFMRKGADCLKKYVGESERNIKLLFQQATKMKPSIIFFDEIDALAPVRSVRQEQVHTSVVGTLLAEMDGMCDRGSVVVIGATNRLDAVDPALRRAGRLDRELHFPAPAAPQRADILRVHTRHWRPPPADSMVRHVADVTTGYGGSDLKALCSESVLRALERTYPQVYKTPYALLIDPQKVEVLLEDMVGAMRTLVAAGARVAPPPARALLPHLRPLLASTVEQVFGVATRVFPLADKTHTSSTNLYNQHLSSVLLVLGECATSHIGPAVLSVMEHCALKEISLSTLHQGVCVTPEQAILSIFSEVRRAGSGSSGCVVYAPGIDLLWRQLGDGGTALLLHQWQEVSANANCFLLATSECQYEDLPDQIQSLFPVYKDCIYNIKEPSTAEVSNFLCPLFTTKALEPPVTTKEKLVTELPKAPPIPPPQPSEEDKRKTARREAHLLRELRIFLRDVCRKLAANRRFYKFTKPVDLEEVTDYLDIIKQPMDLESMMTKVDLHRYNCARDFLEDIDLICANALEYNPDRTSSDKQIRHEACSLRDHAHALVEVEMDSDFEEECRAIAARRVSEGLPHDKDLPNFIYTANLTNLTVDHGAMSATSCNTVSPQAGDSVLEVSHVDEGIDENLSAVRKRKKRKKCSLWSKGIAKKHKPSGSAKDCNNPIITDEESKENKPLCPSPILEDPTSISPGKPSDPGCPVPEHAGEEHPSHTPSSPIARNEGVIGPVKKLHLDNVEMLFDGNTVDVSNSKILDSHVSPGGRHKDRRSSGMLTSTPYRKKSSSLEHFGQDYEKVIINKAELEITFTKCLKVVKVIRMKPLLELYCQLERVINKYNAQYDRSGLPADLQTTADKFKQALSQE